jgi:small GTP-binding protein
MINNSNSEDDITISYQFKLILLGDSGVGKSSLLHSYMKEGFQDNIPCTINADFKIKKLKIDPYTIVNITIWDTCGQEKYRAMTNLYFKDSNGIILLYDVIDKNSFYGINSWLNEIYKNINEDEISIILVGNKIDLESEREVKKEEVEKYCKESKLNNFEISIKSNKNINLMMNIILKAFDQISYVG